MTAPSALRYRPELDGLRAVAVLLVLVHHTLQPHRFAGFVGVDIFFALSGYLITTILLGEVRRSGRLRFGVFYARRMLRLYPALITMLVFTFGLFPLLNSAGLLVQAKRTLVAATYTGNLYMTYRHQWLGPQAHTWSLALEEQYYLVWPIVLLLALRAGLRRGGLAAALIVLAAGSAVQTVRTFTFGTSSFPIQSTSVGLLAGSALAVGLSTVPWVARVSAHRFVGPLGAGVLGAALVLFSVTASIADGWYVLAAVVASVLVIAAATARPQAGLIVRTLSRPAAVGLGRISYGVYLWHYPLVLLVARHLAGWPPGARLVIVAPAAIGIAWLSYRLVETPFLRWKNRLGQRPADAPPASPGSALAGRPVSGAGTRGT